MGRRRHVRAVRAHNPSLRRISSRAERGAVSNAAWNTYNAINVASLAVVGVGHVAGRLTEVRTSNLSQREQPLVRAMDVLTATGVVSGILNGVQGARLARQAPQGAVPIETGMRPAPETPPQAKRIQHSLSVLGPINLLSGIGLVASTRLFWRSAVSRPPMRRAVRARARR
jgi:hypothetical protein